MKFGQLVIGVMLVGAVAGAWTAVGANSAKETHKVPSIVNEASDPYLWLEDVHGQKPLAWVAQQNARARGILQADPNYQKNFDSVLKVLDATDRIPYGALDHDKIYNFWQDAGHAKGIWRRTGIADYAKPAPAWDTLIDLDKLAADEHEDWVWKGADCNASATRCLISLSRGGGDAVVVREFDLATKSFVKDGFALAEAKSQITWLDDDRVLFGTDFGPGSMTTSGYPNVVKLWKRGTPMASAQTIFTGKLSDVSSGPAVFREPSGAIALVQRGISFFESEYYLVNADGTTTKLNLPLGADLKGASKGQLLFTLRDDWNGFAKGTLIAADAKALAANSARFTVLYAPDARSSIDEVAAGRDAVYASIYNNVTGSIHVFRARKDGWSDTKLELPAGGSTHIVSTNDWGPEAQYRFESFLTPTTLYADSGDGKPATIKSLPARFDASNLVSEQFFATSKDGTKVPYFVTRPKTLAGPAPTVLYGYGGFEISETPVYSANFGNLWTTRGGIYVLANIRGGGEFGPAWHQAALKENRQKAYDDFQAVAEDLVKRGLTTPKQLGIMGGSNGGLLVSANMVERPELFGAVVCQVPLIDMIRYTHIGAGASWIGEYGDPADAKAREYISKYSPYQNVKPGKAYPPVLFVTATSDDRVTPVHARKMAAKMEAQGHDVLFYENTDGGHAAAANHKQAAEMWALSFVYLSQKLKL
ncbi:MAG TPA: prolyl oligopeptidase family serine peptidase [Rhizomicrobium sp.]|jgi:prolyl oligopeptidase